LIAYRLLKKQKAFSEKLKAFFVELNAVHGLRINSQNRESAGTRTPPQLPTPHLAPGWRKTGSHLDFCAHGLIFAVDANSHLFLTTLGKDGIKLFINFIR